jgi:hypothetical protein
LFPPFAELGPEEPEPEEPESEGLDGVVMTDPRAQNANNNGMTAVRSVQIGVIIGIAPPDPQALYAQNVAKRQHDVPRSPARVPNRQLSDFLKVLLLSNLRSVHHHGRQWHCVCRSISPASTIPFLLFRPS